MSSSGPAFAWSLATSGPPATPFNVSRKMGGQGVGPAGPRADRLVLVLRPRPASADRDVLRRLHVDGDALQLGQLRPQSANHLVGARRPFALRFQGDEQAAVGEWRR